MPTASPKETCTPLDLAELVARHQRGLWRYLRALGAAPDLAEDVVQETFVLVWQRQVVDRGDAAMAVFLRTTARQKLLRRRRDEGRREELLVELADQRWQSTCAHDGGDAWLAALAECTAALDDRARTALHLCYGPGSDRDGAARALGLKPNGLKTLLQRLRALLRECIERKYGDRR